MIYQISVTATYDADADTVFDEALNFREMQEAMKGLAVYEGLPDRPLRQGDTIYVDVTMFGFLKTKAHCMHAEKLDKKARVVQSREYNKGIKRWDHNLSVQPTPNGCIWRDTIVLDAGPMTFLTARFCRFVYMRRHRLRKANSITATIQRAEGS